MSKKIMMLVSIVISLLTLMLTAAVAQQNRVKLAGQEQLTVECEGRWLVINRESSTKVTVDCRPLALVQATGTPQAQAVQPAKTAAPSADIPPCSTHDPTVWHPLFDEAHNCHYDHEHKADPHRVDDIFGPVGALYKGQEISYPWQTFNDMGTENEMKHAGYGWLVRQDMGCFSQYSDGCLTDFRVQYHAVMASVGAVTRYHSFWLEARGCRENQPEACGLIRTGGWIDFGYLLVDGEHVPLPNDPDEIRPGAARRLHAYKKGNLHFGTWYGGNHLVSLALTTGRMWGHINPSNPAELHLFCPDYQCKRNNSTMEAHIVGFSLPPEWDSDGDGIINLKGYTNRHGELVEGCQAIGLDCVPLEIVDMPVGSYQYRDDGHEIEVNQFDYDSSPEGEYWITYPN